MTTCCDCHDPEPVAYVALAILVRSNRHGVSTRKVDELVQLKTFRNRPLRNPHPTDGTKRYGMHPWPPCSSCWLRKRKVSIRARWPASTPTPSSGRSTSRRVTCRPAGGHRQSGQTRSSDYPLSGGGDGHLERVLKNNDRPREHPAQGAVQAQLHFCELMALGGEYKALFDAQAQ